MPSEGGSGESGGQSIRGGDGDGDGDADADYRWAPPCEATNRTETLLDDVDALDISVAGGQIVFADWSLGTPYLGPASLTGGIRAVSVDGTNARVLFTAPEDHQLFNAFADEDGVYFPMTQPIEDPVYNNATYLWRMSLAGGEPTLFSMPAGSYDRHASIVASDAGSLYVENGAELVRVSKHDGTAVVIADMEDDYVGQAQLFDGKIWFVTVQGDGYVRSVPADASGLADEIFGQDTCYLVDTLSVTPGGVFCGLNKFGMDGKRFDLDNQLQPYTPQDVSLPWGNKVVLYGLSRMDELDVISFEQRTLVCDATSAIDLEVGEDAVYWLEGGPRDGKRRLFRAPR